jgi:hypothetical protein
MRFPVNWSWAFVPLLIASILVACSDGDGDLGHDGASRDATIVDGGISFDGVVFDGSPRTDGSVFVSCPAPEPCDPVEDTGCADARCVLEPDGPECVPDDGDGEVGDPCESSVDCAAGRACFESRAGGAFCRQLCCDDESCGVGERCGAGELAGGDSTSYGRCHSAEAACDLLDPINTCDLAEACYVLSLTGAVGCRPAGRLQVGQRCAEVNDCEPGLACRGLVSTCRRVCAVGEPYACPAAEGTCIAQPTFPAGVGLCGEDLTTQID